MTAPRKWQRRDYEKAAMVAARQTRVLYLFWTRRGRKSTTLGAMAFDAMSSQPGQSVIAASASLLVGSELVSMTLSATEQAIKVQQEAEALRASLINSCSGAAGTLQLVAAASDTGKVYKGLSDDDYHDLYRSKRLEFRLHFDRAKYSRLLVIAPNPATARGWGGWVFRDEQMFVHPAMERDLQTATDPIIDTDPTFRLVYASNLCGDDRHPGYEMTLPRDNVEFTPNPQGHFYRSQTGIMVHRVDLADAYAAGHTLFDKRSGKPMPLPEALAGMSVAARKNNYMLVHEASGSAAVDAVALHSAQQRGVGRCACVYVDSDLDFSKALTWLSQRLAPGLPTAIGFDVATTTGGVSNPSSCSISQDAGLEIVTPLNLLWKTRDSRLARERLKRIIETCRHVAPPRRFCIDASNERYFADEVRQEFASLVPVELVLNGAAVDPLPPGYEAAINYKTYLGDLYCSKLNDNRFVLPPEAYLKKDHRQVIKQNGTYSCEADLTDGGHGDTFDSGKLALYGLQSGGPVEAAAVQRGTYGCDPIELHDRMRPDPNEDARNSQFSLQYP